jgi:hypothetical protein
MRWGVLLVTLLMIPGFVLAGTISLTTSVTTEVLTTEEGSVQISITNSGDESAYNVQLSLLSDYFTSASVPIGTLNINEPFATNISINANSDVKEGNYPLILLTEYTDANGYPFSSVSPVTITYKTPHPSRITGVFENIELSGKRTKDFVLKLKNMDQVGHDVQIELFLPNELSSDSTEKILTLGSKEEKELIFKVSNFAGLEGSNYVILASIEYDDDYHHSSITSGIVKIVEGKSISNIPKWIIFPIIAVLVIIFIFYQFKSRFTLRFVNQDTDKDLNKKKEKKEKTKEKSDQK